MHLIVDSEGNASALVYDLIANDTDRAGLDFAIEKGLEHGDTRLRQACSTSAMIRLMCAESMLPFGSSRVIINVPFDPPPSSCGRIP